MDVMIESLQNAVTRLMEDQAKLEKYKQALEDIVKNTHGSTAHTIARVALENGKG